MNTGKRSRMLGCSLAATLVGCLAIAAPSFAAKTLTKTFTVGVGSPTGGTALTIPDGGGTLTQLVRSPIKVKGLNPRGKLKDVNVGVRADHPAARDLEFYLATPRGVIGLSSDNGGAGNDYGGTFDSCAGQFTLFDSDSPSLISDPAFSAPFPGAFAPEESLNKLDGLGGKKATNATWSLLVEDDDAANPAGTLFCWKLTIKQTNPKKK